MKLWDKGNHKAARLSKAVEAFTVGKDREFDLLLAEYDVQGSLAHAQMLESVGLLSKKEFKSVQKALQAILKSIRAGKFTIEEGVEDVHSQIELLLTRMTGEAGKKIHSGRSRNDQVLTDIKLFIREEIRNTVKEVQLLFEVLMRLSEQHRQVLMPGYTHFQAAMPSSFGLWFGAYAESLADDLEMMLAAYRVVNKNPLGSGAGYGSSFPLNRSLTTRLLRFDDMHYNVVYAQMTRGKTEKVTAMAMACIAATLSKLAYDVCLYMSQNFGFITFPDELTTGSSIMPHKKNPDVFELIRARCNRIQALPNEITLLINNLPSGYHRDMQLLKEMLFPAFTELQKCLQMTAFMLQHIRVNGEVIKEEKYKYIFSVEAVNAEVKKGMPFRDAYKKVAADIEAGRFNPPKKIIHTHAGSIGNLCHRQIAARMKNVCKKFF
ncbi:MAG: argininosuccinate lyase [Chitinophagales bacterium]|nr:MAG: argininosuccinate lyase [Chitinophagales bacterium]